MTGDAGRYGKRVKPTDPAKELHRAIQRARAHKRARRQGQPVVFPTGGK